MLLIIVVHGFIGHGQSLRQQLRIYIYQGVEVQGVLVATLPGRLEDDDDALVHRSRLKNDRTYDAEKRPLHRMVELHRVELQHVGVGDVGKPVPRADVRAVRVVGVQVGVRVLHVQ